MNEISIVCLNNKQNVKNINADYTYSIGEIAYAVTVLSD